MSYGHNPVLRAAGVEVLGCALQVWGIAAAHCGFRVENDKCKANVAVGSWGLDRLFQTLRTRGIAHHRSTPAAAPDATPDATAPSTTPHCRSWSSPHSPSRLR
eukprot:366369-Chlamydomonas_euryale.AAC.12